MRLSLRVKLFIAFVMTSAMLLAAVSWLASDYLKEDKKTYIFDLNLDIAINLSEAMHIYISSTMNDVSILADFLEGDSGKNSLKDIFKRYDEINILFSYDGNNFIPRAYKKDALLTEYAGKIKQYSIPVDSILSGKVYIRNSSLSKDNLSFFIAMPYSFASSKETSIAAAIVSSEKLMNRVNQLRGLTAYLFDEKGKIIVHNDVNKVVENTDVSNIQIVTPHLNGNTFEETIEFHDRGKSYLGAYSPVKDTDLGVVVQRPQEDAFIALENLKDETKKIIGFVFILALLASIGLAKMLTDPLKELEIGAREIGKGNFFAEIKVKSKDEIGMLAKTLREMGERIDKREKQLRKTYEKLVSSEKIASCYFIGQKISSTLDLEKVFDMSVTYAKKLADAKASVLLLYDEKTKRLNGKAADGIRKDQIIKFSFQTNGLTAGDELDKINESQKLKAVIKKTFNAKFSIIAPITIFNNIYGVLILINKINLAFSKNDYNFSKGDYNLLRLFAAQCAIACENARLYQKTEYMAIRDGLTGLFNRTYFSERAREEFALMKRQYRPLSFLMFDLDHFKNVNDTYGHLIGDAVLKDIAAILQATLRDIDIPIRYGGEEFVVMLISTDKNDAAMLAERLRVKVESNKFEYDDNIVPITISIGVASIADIQSDKDAGYSALVKCADTALYKAKEGGRNRVETFEVEKTESTRKKQI